MMKSSVSIENYSKILSFYHYEAELLDDGKFRDWLDLLAEEVIYQMPVRVTRESNAGSGFSDEAYHMDETFGSLQVRIARLETEYAWAEDPPSRTRHFVTNIRAVEGEQTSQFLCKSNVLLYRNRFDSPQYHLISAERHDVIKVEGANDFKLLKRRILLDQSTLGTQNLAIFF